MHYKAGDSCHERYSKEPLVNAQPEKHRRNIEITSTKILRLKGNIFVGKRLDIKPPPSIMNMWAEDILPRLSIDLQEISNAMISVQPDASIVEPHLCMCGVASKGQTYVTLRPCIWIRCGSKRCKELVQTTIKNLNWLGFITVEVHVRSPWLATSGSGIVPPIEVPLSQNGISTFDGSSLFIHVEHRLPGSSACGMLCLASIARDGQILQQKLSRVGGLLFTMNTALRWSLCAVTTAHGMFGQGYTTNANSTVGSSESSNETESDDYDTDSEPEDDHTYESSVLFGAPNLNRVATVWQEISSERLLNFLGKSHNSILDETPSNNELPKEADCALLDIANVFNLLNTYKSPDGVLNFLDSHIKDSGLGEGIVHLVFGEQDVVEGYMLPEPSVLLIQGTIFHTRKIELQYPICELMSPSPIVVPCDFVVDMNPAPGTSGSWVVQNGAMCGMIIAGYDNEPYAHIVTAEHLFSQIYESNSAVQVGIAETKRTNAMILRHDGDSTKGTSSSKSSTDISSISISDHVNTHMYSNIVVKSTEVQSPRESAGVEDGAVAIANVSHYQMPVSTTICTTG